MVGFRYQLFDNYLQEDILFFDKIGYGFVLKPEKLRYIPVIIKETQPNDPLLNFETRTLQKDYYKFDGPSKLIKEIQENPNWNSINLFNFGVLPTKPASTGLTIVNRKVI